MPNYLTFKDFSLRTGRSLASVYRDAEKGFLKIIVINGKKHIDIEDKSNFIQGEDVQVEKMRNTENEKIEKNYKEYQDAEIIENSPQIRYELEIFKNSIATIEDMANRIEMAKDETIKNIKEECDKKDKNIENLNEIIKTISQDNHELRTQLAIRDTERTISDKKLEEYEKINCEKDKEISQLNEKIDQLNEQLKLQDKKENFWLKAKKL